MLIWGGEANEGTPKQSGTLGDGAAYDPATNLWTPLASAGAPSPRVYQMAVWTGQEMLVWGGCGNCNPTGEGISPLHDGAAYTPPPAPPPTPVALPHTGGGGAARRPRLA